MDVNLNAPINQLGYGIASCNILKALIREGNDVALWPVGRIETSARDANTIKECLDRTYTYNCKAPSIRIYHQNDLALRAGRGKAIGFPIFELDRFTDIELNHLRSVDELFVCSTWAKGIINQYPDMPPTHVIPLGVDGSIFHPDATPATFENPTSDTIFINIGKWEVRKGHHILCEAFSKAFTPNDNVQLFLNTCNPFNTPEESQRWVDSYKTSPMGERINIIEHRLDNQWHVAGLMMIADCGVFPALAEGWNLEVLEMMACGKHVITTNYSGNTEFCNTKNSLLIPVDTMEDAYDGKWFSGQGQWAAYGTKQMEMLIGYMQGIHKLKQEGALGKNTEGIKTAERFTWNNSAKHIIRALENNG